MREVIEIGEADAVLRFIGAGDRIEVDVVDRVVAIAIDEIDVGAANAFDGGYVKFARTNR